MDIDELCRLKILNSARQTLVSTTFGRYHLQSPEEILTTFQKLCDNITFEEL
jgi:hypothetical protein